MQLWNAFTANIYVQIICTRHTQHNRHCLRPKRVRVFAQWSDRKLGEFLRRRFPPLMEDTSTYLALASFMQIAHCSAAPLLRMQIVLSGPGNKSILAQPTRFVGDVARRAALTLLTKRRMCCMLGFNCRTRRYFNNSPVLSGSCSVCSSY